jgi:hypothetical protein
MPMVMTLDGKLESHTKEELIEIIKEVADHDELRRSKRHSDALKVVLDMLENPEPKAWRVSSDSDVLRCPHCLHRVHGANPWRRGDKIKPMNIFACHADSIYEFFDGFECYGCKTTLTPVRKDGASRTDIVSYETPCELVLVDMDEEWRKNEKER